MPPRQPPPEPFSPRPTQPVAPTSASTSWRDSDLSGSSSHPSTSSFQSRTIASTSASATWRDSGRVDSSLSSHLSTSSFPSRTGTSRVGLDGTYGNPAIATNASTAAGPSSSYVSWGAPSSAGDRGSYHSVPPFAPATSRFRCRCNPPSTHHTDDRDCMTDQVFGGQSASTSSGEPRNPRPLSSMGETSSSVAATVTVGTTVTGESSAPFPALAVAGVAAPAQAVGLAPPPPPAASSSAPEGISCPICMDTVAEIKADGKTVVSTNCGHIFCDNCLKGAIKTQKKCPTCRKKLSPKSYHPLFL